MFLNRKGVSLQGISEAANDIGFITVSAKLTLKALEENTNIASLPCILYWNQNHFIVLYEIKKVLTGKKDILLQIQHMGLLP